MARKRPPRITVYTGSRCPHCAQLKRWLTEQGLSFREACVDRDARAAKDFARLGARSVPVTLIGDTRIDGFQPARLRAALGPGS